MHCHCGRSHSGTRHECTVNIETCCPFLLLKRGEGGGHFGVVMVFISLTPTTADYFNLGQCLISYNGPNCFFLLSLKLRLGQGGGGGGGGISL